MNIKKEKYNRKNRRPGKSLRPSFWFAVAGLCLGIIVFFIMTGCDNSTAVEPEPEPQLELGEVKLVSSFDTGNQTEGIAFDRRGNIYVSNTRLTDPKTFERVAEVLRIAPDGGVTKVATIGPVAMGTGAAGLAIDRQGNIYMALDSKLSTNHGVWKIGSDGSLKRLSGSEAIGGPNSLALDIDGNLYVTDSETGAIWRFQRDGGPGEIWVQNNLLAPLPPGAPGDVLPTNQVGANGIAYYQPKNVFYVANTEKGLVARVSIQSDGSAGKVELITKSPLLLSIDGIAVDVSGTIYAAISGARVLQLRDVPTHSIMRIDPATGNISALTTEDKAFDFPTSLVFNACRRRSAPFGLFVVNAAFPIYRKVLGTPEPKVMVVGAGIQKCP